MGCFACATGGKIPNENNSFVVFFGFEDFIIKKQVAQLNNNSVA